MAAELAGVNANVIAVIASGAIAMSLFFVKDFFSTTKSDLRTLTKAVTELVTELKGLTKDLRKVEGVIESQQKQITDFTKETANLLASIKALWSALQRIHPDDIPRRMSDKSR